ncbi:NADP-dependent oxidoreductase [uncultured Ilyobacter sp.]|uniref:NADP-dependent oxidoreductase n=1 Tax=uncultured Ilyobacter sp. TaxID=544433 RepID=UPI0029F4CA71|nr:NADP-dependent oxidoreductase [uncultured Ilyobacter sp.]
MKKTMLASVINEFGDYTKFGIKEVPVPTITDDEILIKLDYAGIGQWDRFEREGGYDQMLGLNSKFPYILGSEGSGNIVSLGKNVKNFTINDKVYAVGFLNPKGGFYAEYVSVNHELVKIIPKTITLLQASVIAGVGLTGLRGLTDVLNLKKGESIAIFGASGGIGHIAVQIAKSIGAKIYAVASESDGISLIKSYGIECVVDGKTEDIITKAHSFGFNNFDKILLTFSHKDINKFIEKFCFDGKVAYPNGVFPEPEKRNDVDIIGYNGDSDKDIINRLHKYIENGEIIPHIDKVFDLDKVKEAHKYLIKHYVGKLSIKVSNLKNKIHI